MINHRGRQVNSPVRKPEKIDLDVMLPPFSVHKLKTRAKLFPLSSFHEHEIASSSLRSSSQ